MVDRRSLGAALRGTDPQGTGGTQPRAASDLCLRPGPLDTVAWTRGQPPHPEGEPAARAVSLAPRFPVSLSGKPRSSCPTCQHDPRPIPTGRLSRPWRRAVPVLRGMEGSFTILQTFPDAHCAAPTCAQGAWGGRVPGCGSGVVGVSSHLGSHLPAEPSSWPRPPQGR